MAAALGKPPAELAIYDPYYCDGAVKRHLAAAGFPRVHNENDDFYGVLAAGACPAHDVLVTNPPYSGDHPQRCVEFALGRNKARAARAVGAATAGRCC